MSARLRQCLFILVTTCALLTLSAQSYAEVTRSQAAAKAKKKHGGKVLNVNKVSSKNGKTVYKVKLLLDGGRVKTVTVGS